MNCTKCHGNAVTTKHINDGDTVNTSSLANVNDEFCYSIEYEIYYKVKARKEHLQHKCKCGNVWREAVTPNIKLGVDDVKMWLELGGKGHILISTNGSWNMTACHMMTPNGERSKYRPIRKCRKCIDELPNLRNASPNANVTGLPERSVGKSELT